VTSVSVEEGQRVAAGTPLAQLRNLTLESASAHAREELTASTAQATQAALRYRDFGTAEQERLRRKEDSRLADDRLSQLTITSPIEGMVATPHVHDLVGRSLDEGDLLLQIEDTGMLRANVYIPEFAMRDIRLGERVRLLINGRVKPVSGTLSLISPVSAPMAEGLVDKEQLQGINPPRYYRGTVMLQNDGGLMPGMTGDAKVLAARRSLAGFAARFTADLFRRKVW
jgi:multidrug resistance efflux pump